MTDVSLNERIGAVADIATGQLNVEDRYKTGLISLGSGASLAIISSSIPAGSVGMLQSILIGAVSTPSLIIYDHASGPSGSILAVLGPNPPIGTYILDRTYLNGLVVQVSAWPSTQVSLSYR